MISNNGIVSIHQPGYFPWLGLLDKIAKSNYYVIMDDVQLNDAAYQNRNIFLTSNSIVKHLTISIVKERYQEKKISELKIKNDKWKIDHWNFLRENYKKHPFFEEVRDKLELFYSKQYDLVVEPVIASMLLAFEWFDIPNRSIRMSELSYDKSASKSELVLSVVKATGYNKYLCGQGSKEYMDFSLFEGEEVEITMHTFKHPKYHQRNSVEFVSGLSCLDMLFNVGSEEAKKIFWSNVHGDK
jgi:hypothetical protein